MRILRHVTAAIYISFSFLFYFMRGMDGYKGPDIMDFITYLFFFAGVFYLFLDLREYIIKKLK